MVKKALTRAAGLLRNKAEEVSRNCGDLFLLSDSGSL